MAGFEPIILKEENQPRSVIAGLVGVVVVAVVVIVDVGAVGECELKPACSAGAGGRERSGRCIARLA